MRTDDQIRRKEREKEDAWGFRAKTISELESGLVALYDIKKKAGTSKENEEYYLPWYEKEKEREDEVLKAAQKTSLYAFSGFYACVLNIILYAKYGSLSLAGHILNDRKDDSYVVVFLVPMLLLIVAYISIAKTFDSTRKVYCPSLAKELKKEHQKWLDAEKKFQDEIRQNINKNKDKKKIRKRSFECAILPVCQPVLGTLRRVLDTGQPRSGELPSATLRLIAAMFGQVHQG